MDTTRWEELVGLWSGRALIVIFIGAVLEVLLHFDEVAAIMRHH